MLLNSTGRFNKHNQGWLWAKANVLGHARRANLRAACTRPVRCSPLKYQKVTESTPTVVLTTASFLHKGRGGGGGGNTSMNKNTIISIFVFWVEP